MSGGPEIPRHRVVNRLLSMYEEPRYLEVGVWRATTFAKVRAARKVAVDPVFQFDVPALAADEPHSSFHEVTSDAYFADTAASGEQFDVIFLDGLHTFEQTLRDLMNAQTRLQPRGVIVVDDTTPTSYAASLPTLDHFREVRTFVGSEDKRWMGDVYRLVWFVETFCPHLSFGTIGNNHGQTVLWRHHRPAQPERTVAQVAATTFEDFVAHRDVMRIDRFGQIQQRLRADLGL